MRYITGNAARPFGLNYDRLMALIGPCTPHQPVSSDSLCRQRQLIILGNRVPTLAPDSWVAPSAVVVGDVDVYERVRP